MPVREISVEEIKARAFGLAPDALGGDFSQEQIRERMREEIAWMGDEGKHAIRAGQLVISSGKFCETEAEYERRAHEETAVEYAQWQIHAAQALRRCRSLDAIQHPDFGTATRGEPIHVTRTADLAPYEVQEPNLLTELRQAQIEDLRSSSSEEELLDKLQWMEFGQRQIFLNEFRRHGLLLANDIHPSDAHLFVPEDQAFGTAPQPIAFGEAPYPLAVVNHNPLTFAREPAKRQIAHRWGPQGQFDFWTAHRHNLVGAPEIRAVELLTTICDEYRANQYLYTGLMPAVGNRTGRTYIVRRDLGGVKELVDGKIKYSWCIHAWEEMPPTDHVISLKNMIEGEEVEFRKTGNRREVLGDEKYIVTGLVHQDAI